MDVKLRIVKYNSPSEVKVEALAEKLSELGVDVELVLNPPVSKSVTFTFVGPAGLIEGGSN